MPKCQQLKICLERVVVPTASVHYQDVPMDTAEKQEELVVPSALSTVPLSLTGLYPQNTIDPTPVGPILGQLVDVTSEEADALFADEAEREEPVHPDLVDIHINMES